MVLTNLRKKFILGAGKVRWEGLREFFTGRRYGLTCSDRMQILEALEAENLVILTWRSAHLSSYMTAFAHWWLTGRWGKWGHAALNVEPGYGIKILESIGSGVRLSKFTEVFDCDAVVLLRPKTSEGFNWEAVVQNGEKLVGRPYDDAFNTDDDSKLSCVELVLQSLRGDPKFREHFHGLAAQMSVEGNLTPDMFYECGSFDVVLEIRR